MKSARKKLICLLLTLLGLGITIATHGMTQSVSHSQNVFLNFITQPNIAYFLLIIGFYGLLFEFVHPGYVAPGVLGAVSLIIAGYALQFLPVNFVGLALLILGLAFFIAELLTASGMLGIAGIFAFVFGSFLLFDSHSGIRVGIDLIATMTIMNAVFFLWILGMAIRARRQPIQSGSETLIGAVATVVEDFDQEGWILIRGERWRAISPVPVKKNAVVKIIHREDLTLKVEPL